MERKTKIVIYCDQWSIGGVETIIMNILQYINYSIFDITILVGQKITDYFDDLIKSLNVNFVMLNKGTTSNPIIRDLKVLNLLKKKIVELNPDIVHINVCNSIGFSYAKIIKKCSSAKTIVHSHNSYIRSDILRLKILFHKINKLRYKYSDYNIACSSLAGKFMFLKKYTTLLNSINYKQFEFNQEYRDKIRSKYNLQNKKVILFIGRFSKQKNHMFFLKSFKKLIKIDSSFHLIIIGSGEKEKQIKKTVVKNNLNDNTTILPPQKEIFKFYSAADLFVLPSFFEGFPVAGVEAQANGLPSLFSNKLCKEIIIGNNSKLLSIKSTKLWVNQILNTPFVRNDNYEKMKNEGFFIEDYIKKLEKIYLSLSE